MVRLILLCIVSLVTIQAGAQTRHVKQAARQADAINNMVLYKGYIHYGDPASVVKPFPSPFMELWRVVYFDEQGRVRKYRREYSCEEYAGEISYFDEQGRMFHLLQFNEFMGSGYSIRVYLENGRVLRGEWSSYNEDTGSSAVKYGRFKNEKVPAKINGLDFIYFSDVKNMGAGINIRMPDDCPKVCFAKPQIGDTTTINSFAAKAITADQKSMVIKSISIGSKVVIHDYVTDDFSRQRWYKVSELLSPYPKYLWVAENELELVEQNIDERSV